MKKKWVMLPALLMITVMCCGCAGLEADNGMDTTEEVSETVVETEAETEAETETDVQEQKEDVSTDYSAICGSVEDGVYTSDYFNLQYEPGQDFEFLDEEQIGELLQMAIDTMDYDSFFEKQFATNQLAVVAMAMNQEGTQNMVIEMVHYDVQDDTAKDILRVDSVARPLEQSGCEDVTAEQYPCEFLGEQTVCLKTHCIQNGYDMYQQQRVIICEDYYAQICATSYMDDKTDEMFEKFSWIE